ncbi:hypothetical protein PRZ48_012147 [Zasmidium cellare]|uniref:Uncharacterized protein n=1 Tax=Zasmidium cellare TaxID=395010 RepID=A0ABR0E410_ZASCE|nr:hypothetical protein PRZ48_012147 [Zasmidium cellare]
MEIDQITPQLHREDSPAPRESMQSVLRELIHVQKLISLLPSRLRSLRCNSAHDTMGGLAVDQAMSSGMAGWPLSARALSLVDDDYPTKRTSDVKVYGATFLLTFKPKACEVSK